MILLNCNEYYLYEFLLIQFDLLLLPFIIMSYLFTFIVNYLIKYRMGNLYVFNY